MYKKFIYQILFVMRLTIVVLILGIMQVSAISFAQKVTYVKKQATLEEIFEVIRVQTGYNVFYSSNKIDDSKKMDVRFEDAELKAVLDLCAEKQSLAYTIEAKNIFFKAREKNIVDKIISLFSVVDVKGKVLDEDGRPLQGASVKVKGGTIGTKTDKGGEFFLKGVPDDAVIVIAYLGYKFLELKASANFGVLKMEQETSKLDEVKISGGYYETTDRLRTGSIVKISAKEIQNQPVTSPLMALQGRVPGLEITPKNGVPGGAQTIRVRGTNSLRGAGDRYFELDPGNYPLYVVDGVPVNSQPTTSVSSSFLRFGFDPLSFLNPQNIESIEVLKDGDATAIYGSRGANGVILISTKQGKTDGKTSIDFNLYRGVGKVSKKLELLNTQQYLQMRHEAFANDGTVPDNYLAADLLLWDTTRYTDWQKGLLGGTANITDATINISVGNAFTSFTIGGGFHKETMIFPGDAWYSNGTVHSSLNHTAPNKKFRTGISFNYGRTNNKLFDDGDFVNYAMTLPPNAPRLYDQLGNLNWEKNPSGANTWINPLSGLKRENSSTSSTLVLNSLLGYEIFPGLIVKMTLGLSELHGNEISKNPISSRIPSSIDSTSRGISFFGYNKRNSWVIEPQVNYSRKWGEEQQLDFVMGSSFQKSNTAFQRLEAKGYVSDDFLESLQAATLLTYQADVDSKYKYASLFGRVGYNYRAKYLLNITGRRDGSSRFGPGKKFGNFGSIGGGWIFSEEAFSRRYLKFIHFAKIRASYGITGSDQIGDYKYYDLYRIGTAYNNTSAIYPDALYNADFGWELTRKLEVGMQLEFLEGGISIEINAYKNRSSNQLVNYSIPATTGFPSILSNFAATIENTGLETVINTTNIIRKKFKWTTSFNITLPQNKLVKFDGIETSPYADIYEVGKSLNIRRLYTWLGVSPQSGIHRFSDKNADGVVNDDDRSFMYPRDQTYYGGLTNNLRYKNFELTFLLQFASSYSDDFLAIAPGIGNNQPVSVLERWRNLGDITSVQKFSQSYFSNIATVLSSDYLIKDATFARLKTLSLTYMLPQKIRARLKMQEARVYMQGQNLFTVTQLKNLDPETGSSLPPLRMITVGLHIKF